ncbi:MAG: pantoate--beta-alanine ligase [Bacteroidia bacterium]|nr:pantoate--beta-alanine ligase [Bacteroidia bacterium]
MFIFKSAVLLHSELTRLQKNGRSIGFVPTMGALHQGHLSLLERAKAENDTVVCSIFVNPKQFDDEMDLVNYPDPIQTDIEYLRELNLDYLFHPDVDQVYGPDYVDIDVPLNGLDLVFEGEQRPGHFQGVAKVIRRFFDIVQPTRAYFGQKDFQQTVVVRHLIQHFGLNTDLVVCPIVREHHGLAMSSRNERLEASKRERASFIYKSLLKLKERCYFKSLGEALEITTNYLQSIEDANLEYLVCVNGVTMQEVKSLDDADYIVACTVVEFGGVRLLDNIVLKDNLNNP